MIASVAAQRSFRREGSLSFSCPQIEIFVRAGEAFEGGFTVSGREGAKLQGLITTGDIRMRCRESELVQNPSQIHYRFDSTGLSEGDTLRGEFKLISGQGEYTLPYTVSIVPDVFETSLGPMRNLFHFANLAKTNWQEAVRLFYTPGFERILSGNDVQYRNLYKALSAPPEREQKVEEFLMWIRKKQRVSYTLAQEELSFCVEEEVTRQAVTLTKNGWGYIRLRVETEGAFLQSEKEILTDDDFLGNQCACGFLLLRWAMHKGRNFGKIRFYNEYLSIEIPVCAERREDAQKKRGRHKKQRITEFYRAWLYYGMGRLTKQKWLAQAESALKSMSAGEGGNTVWELMRAHILLTRERRREAGALLGRIGDIGPKQGHAEIRCYALYLTALASGEERYARTALEEIRRVYQTDQTNWRIAWLLLYLDEEWNGSLSRRWVFLEQQFEKGCRSPVWYLEAALTVRKNPAFLIKRTPFVMQVLSFMAKYDFLNEECVHQLCDLAGRLKGYSDRMFRILCGCYEKDGGEEPLREICALLIRGNKAGPAYLKWYREGILRGLWLTRLYEYYIFSIDLEQPEEIPVSALRYFSYRSELPADRTAYLYAYVVRKSREYPELYQTYVPDMEKFLTDQLERGFVNRNVAKLLKQMVREGILGEDILSRYADRLFFQEIRIDSPNIRRVAVVHGKLQGEAVYTVNRGTACVPVYDTDHSLIFEDAAGCRFVCDIPYQRTVIFWPEEMLQAVLPAEAGLAAEQAGVLLYQCELGKGYAVIDKRNAGYARRLWSCKEIEESYRKQLGVKLLHYYAEQDMGEELDAFLLLLRPEDMNGRERAEALQCMVWRGMYETAYEWLCLYGAEEVPLKLIVRICGRLLAGRDLEESENMTALAHYAFRSGKYNEEILRYLGMYYEGTTQEMRELWLACERFETGSRELSEKLLLRMLFTGTYMEEEDAVFERYVKEEADETLAACFLEHLAYEYFMNGKTRSPQIWQELKRRNRNGELHSEICRLALLLNLSQREKLDEEERRIVQEHVNGLVFEKGIVFEFFRKFRGLIPEMAYFDDKVFLEYRTSSERPVTLHYMIKSEGTEGDYRTDGMRSCYAGIYTRSFPLFYGEELAYYITENAGEKETLLESGTLRRDDIRAGSGAGRYGMTNDYIIALSQGKDGSAKRILEEYYQRDFASKELFTLL